MAKIDKSYKFDPDKNYAIGALQANSMASDAPMRFAKKPPHVTLQGGILINEKVKSAQDYLTSPQCPFAVGTSVHFYEVTYGDGEPQYKHVYTGTPIAPKPQPPKVTLSDSVETQQPVSAVFVTPPAQTDTTAKSFITHLNEQITYLNQSIVADKESFNEERLSLQNKINAQNDRIVDLNIEINTLKAEKASLEIRYEEAQKYMDMLKEQAETLKATQTRLNDAMMNDNDIEPPGLADKAVATIDTMLGDGASGVIVAGIADGLGKGISSLIELGVGFLKNKMPNEKQEKHINNIEAKTESEQKQVIVHASEEEEGT